MSNPAPQPWPSEPAPVAGQSRLQTLSCSIRDLLKGTQDPLDALGPILEVLRRGLDLEAAAFRIADEEDFPYVAHCGFPDSFIEAETHIRAHVPAGEPMVDDAGRPVFECICGRVVMGQSEGPSPLFTPGGSAWTNDVRPVVEVRPGEPPHVHTRDCCIEHGYRSIAIVPIRVGGHVQGTLQVNDRRPGRLSPDLIAGLEELMAMLGRVLETKQGG